MHISEFHNENPLEVTENELPDGRGSWFGTLVEVDGVDAMVVAPPNHPEGYGLRLTEKQTREASARLLEIVTGWDAEDRG